MQWTENVSDKLDAEIPKNSAQDLEYSCIVHCLHYYVCNIFHLSCSEFYGSAISKSEMAIVWYVH